MNTNTTKDESQLAEYLFRQRDRVELDCGKDCIFEHGTYWCSNTAMEWANQYQREAKDVTYKDWAGWSSFMFVRDSILRGMFNVSQSVGYPIGISYDEQVGTTIPDVLVVGKHASKSVILPVMQFEWLDLLVTARYNFHDWKVSIRLPAPVTNEDLMGIVTTDHHLLNPVYFEGFPHCYIYPPMSANDYEITAQFSTMFSNNYDMYTFFWLLKKWYDKRLSYHLFES